MPSASVMDTVHKGLIEATLDQQGVVVETYLENGGVFLEVRRDVDDSLIKREQVGLDFAPRVTYFESSPLASTCEAEGAIRIWVVCGETGLTVVDLCGDQIDVQYDHFGRGIAAQAPPAIYRYCQ